MKKVAAVGLFTCFGYLVAPAAGLAGKGYMGGGEMNYIVTSQESISADRNGAGQGGAGQGGDTGGGDTGGDMGGDGPDDHRSVMGNLYGDLYKILRQQGVTGDQKLIPTEKVPLNPNGYFHLGIQLLEPTDQVVGGEPVLTVIDPNTPLGDPNLYSDYGWFSLDISTDGIDHYVLAQSPYPAQCEQPVASFERWGDISSRSGLTKNRLPQVITYDATWNRSECEVGKLLDKQVNPETGELTLVVDPYFIPPCLDESGNTIPNVDCTWKDPNNPDPVTYPHGVTWKELFGEIHFGRLNVGRSPESVLQASFDEAINNINSDDTIAIDIDASGRLLLTMNVYDEFAVDPDTGQPILLGTVQKAIDSPLENLALYVKLMKDGHLVTPADERAPIDRSLNGGIPVSNLLELEDGPAAAPLRPTIDIKKLQDQGLGSLVDVQPVTYLTYYQCVDQDENVTPCYCWDFDPQQAELDKVLVACENVVGLKLFTTTSETCPPGLNADNPIVCEGPFFGILTEGNYAANGTDLSFAASFLAAAADKTGDISVDMVVYLNSILGINKVNGYSAYEEDGQTPADGAIDYSKHPEYFNFNQVIDYDRNTISSRVPGGLVRVLQGGESSGVWQETDIPILAAIIDDKTIFSNIGQSLATGFPDGSIAKNNILGFTQKSDDDLSIINFIHTYEIPSLR